MIQILGLLVAMSSLIGFALLMTDSTSEVSIAVVKGLMFGFVLGHHDLDEEKVKWHHFQIGLGFIVVTINWDTPYEDN